MASGTIRLAGRGKTLIYPMSPRKPMTPIEQGWWEPGGGVFGYRAVNRTGGGIGTRGPMVSGGLEKWAAGRTYGESVASLPLGLV